MLSKKKKNVLPRHEQISNSSEKDEEEPLWNVKEKMRSLTFASAVGRGIIITNHQPLEAFEDTDTRRHSSFWPDSSRW